jgi:hypothetical protein
MGAIEKRYPLREPGTVRQLTLSSHTLAGMRASGEFHVESFKPAALDPSPADITTALPVGIAVMEKRYEGEVSGRSATLFTSAFAGAGTYVAMESFEGSLNGVAGTFNFAHSATTSGSDRMNEFFLIVPASGTAALAGIRGGGGMTVDADGTHRVWFEYDLD